MKKTMCILICTVMLFSLCSCSSTKTVEFSSFEGKFNPFSANSAQDVSVLAQIFERAATPEAIEKARGEGFVNAYTDGEGIADINISYVFDEENDWDTATINYVLGDDVTFSDGTPITAKDVAFSMYVCAQQDYVGWANVTGTDLDGLKAYWYGTEEAENVKIPFDDIKAELANPSEETAKLLRERTIIPLLRSEYEWICGAYGDDVYNGTDMEQMMKDYPDARDLLVHIYAIDQSYTAGDKTPEQVIEDLADQYGTDYVTLGNVYGSDLMAPAYKCAERVLVEQKLLELAPVRNVDSIRGIEIINDKTLKIVLHRADTHWIKTLLGVFVAPFDYYGDGCTFDGKSFKIDLESVYAKDKPLGSGRYVFSSYKKGTVTLKKNKKCRENTEDLPETLRFKSSGRLVSDNNNEYFVPTDIFDS